MLLLQSLLDDSEFLTRETRHIEPPCNKAGLSKFHLEFVEYDEFQISLKCYFSFSRFWIIQNF